MAVGDPLSVRRGDGTSTYFIIDDNEAADDKTERERDRRTRRDGDPPLAKPVRPASATEMGRDEQNWSYDVSRREVDVDSRQTMLMPGQGRPSFGVCPGTGIGSDGYDLWRSGLSDQSIF